MKKIILSIIILLMVTGCSSKEDELDKMSNAIVNFHQNYYYDISDLNEENQKILNEFQEQEKEDNKIINISKLDLFSEDMTTDSPDSNGVYKEKGNYYIKYSDLDFKKVNEKDYIASINVNGYIVELVKANFPILYDDTQNINYSYRFMKKEVKDNMIYYYYRSYGNGSMLTIEYKMNNNKVKDINLIYDRYYLLDEIEEVEEEKSNFGYIVFMGLITVGLAFIIIKTLKMYSSSRKF